MTSTGIYDAVKEAVAGRSEHTALTTEGRRWTGGALLRAAEELAERLARRKDPRTPVVAELADPVATAVLTLACDLAGVLAFHRDPAASATTHALPRRHLLLRDGRTRNSDGQQARWSTEPSLWGATRELPSPAENAEKAEAAGDTRELPQTAQVFCTSGSTGVPTGVVRTPRAVLADARRVGAHLDYGPGHAVVVAAPVFHLYGNSLGLIAPLLRGSPVTYCPGMSLPSRLARAVREAGAATLVALPYHYRLLSGVGQGATTTADIDPAELAGLRQAVSSGGPLASGTAERLAERYDFTLLNCYGSTETAATSLKPVSGEESPQDIGAPLPGVEARIVDGELQVRCDSMAAGRVTPDGSAMTPLVDEDGWYATGDLAEPGGTSPGGFVLRGRIGHLINVAGKKVSPVEVEQVMARHPAVDEVQVLPAPDPERGQVPVARVVLRAEVTPAALIGWCRERMPPYQVPRSVEVLSELPRSATGKPLRVPTAEAAR